MPLEQSMTSELSLPRDISPQARERFLSVVRSAIEDSPGQLVVDCSSMNMVTSLHVSLLWEVREYCEAGGIDIQLSSSSSAMRRVLAAMDLDGMFQPMYDERAAAQAISAPISQAYVDTFSPTVDGVQESLSRFIVFMADLDITSGDAYQLQTAFYEIASNIAQYSGLNAESKIRVSVASDPGQMTIVFHDAGVPFNPTAVDHCSDFRALARQGITRGLGLGMVHRLVDRVEYTQGDNAMNALTLTKKWRIG